MSVNAHSLVLWLVFLLNVFNSPSVAGHFSGTRDLMVCFFEYAVNALMYF